ncbi:hypothetical protein B0H14DRAFT_3712977 [Mycena olivaceomarginata]|nr:hypothetical protein B0H14DRAFT_3712977 [Mycena olivaceomarginata]
MPPGGPRNVPEGSNSRFFRRAARAKCIFVPPTGGPKWFNFESLRPKIFRGQFGRCTDVAVTKLFPNAAERAEEAEVCAMLLESASPPSFSTQDDAIVKRRERSPAAGIMVPMSQASAATRAPFGSLHSAARGIRRRSVESIAPVQSQIAIDPNGLRSQRQSIDGSELVSVDVDESELSPELEVKSSTRARLNVQLDVQFDGQLRLQLRLIRISGLHHLGYGTRCLDFRSCAAHILSDEEKNNISLNSGLCFPSSTATQSPAHYKNLDSSARDGGAQEDSASCREKTVGRGEKRKGSAWVGAWEQAGGRGQIHHISWMYLNVPLSIP